MESLSCIDMMKKYPALKVTKVMGSEAGASVYSASELAAKEFPDLDVSIRGAVSTSLSINRYRVTSWSSKS